MNYQIESIVSFVQKKHPLFEFREYGHQSMVSFARHMPEVFEVTKDEATNGDFVLLPKQNHLDNDQLSKSVVNIDEVTVVVKNFTSPINDLEILFNMAGGVVSANKNENNVAEIVMASMQDAQNAIKQFNGQVLDGNKLNCAIQTSKS